jgi:hypothetical protein
MVIRIARRIASLLPLLIDGNNLVPELTKVRHRALLLLWLLNFENRSCTCEIFIFGPCRIWLCRETRLSSSARRAVTRPWIFARRQIICCVCMPMPQPSLRVEDCTHFSPASHLCNSAAACGALTVWLRPYCPWPSAAAAAFLLKSTSGPITPNVPRPPRRAAPATVSQCLQTADQGFTNNNEMILRGTDEMILCCLIALLLRCCFAAGAPTRGARRSGARI